ncbi:hypothetical protein C8J56DRAFT_900026 [Mycena floridula]|nr:hypothetical protein C8J56DRAFT_900026 [Mycena floridula]
MDARKTGFKAETIQQAWQKSGIDVDETGRFPRVTPDIFTAADFAPSVSTSTRLNMPEGYPAPVNSYSSSSSSSSGSDDEPDTPYHHIPHDPNTEFRTPVNFSVLPPTSAQLDNPDLFPSQQSHIAPLTSSRHDNFSSSSDENYSDDDTDRLLDPDILLHKLRKYKRHHNLQTGFATDAQERAEGATANAIMAGEHIKSLQGKLNAKEQRKKGGNDRIVHIGSRVITSQEGLEEALRQKESRDARIQEEKDRDQRKEDSRVAIRTRRTTAGPQGLIFEGSLRSQKVQDLRDIAWSLGLDESGTIPVLMLRLTSHFDDNPLLKVSAQFVNLFSTKKRGTKRPASEDADDADDEGNTVQTMSSHRRQLQDLSNSPSRLAGPSNLQSPGPFHIAHNYPHYPGMIPYFPLGYHQPSMSYAPTREASADAFQMECVTCSFDAFPIDTYVIADCHGQTFGSWALF